MTRVDIGAVAEFPLGSVRLVQAGDKMVAVFHRPEGFFALEDLCSHRAGPLSEGKVEGLSVTCPWHGARFDLKSGACQHGPATRPVKAFPVVLERDRVVISVG